MSATQFTAVFAAIGLLVPILVNAYLSIRNGKKLDVVHSLTNSTLSHVQSKLDVSEARVSVQQSALDRGAAATGGSASAPVDRRSSPTPLWLPASYVPAWSQLNGILPDGAADSQADADCGETCVSMLVAAVHGVAIEPGAVRQRLHGWAGSGLTNGEELVAALKYYSTAAHVELLAGQPAWDRISAILATARNVIILGHWEGPGTFLHWVLTSGLDHGLLNFSDPWSGQRAYMTQAQFLELEAGQLVISNSHVHYDCRQWPNPT